MGKGKGLTTVGFDADDTLWHNERLFRLTQERFAGLLAEFADPDHLIERLAEAEIRNLRHYGYGVKGFVLSMIETAVEVTEERVPATVIRELIDAGHEMLSEPIELLPHAGEVVERLAETYTILLITKGDLLDQERKLAQSGLGDHFDGVEIVSEKTAHTYTDIFGRAGDGPERALMVGNSLRSDVVPAIAAGAWGVHVPHHPQWEHERESPPTGHPRYAEIADLGALPGIVAAAD